MRLQLHLDECLGRNIGKLVQLVGSDSQTLQHTLGALRRSGLREATQLRAALDAGLVEQPLRGGHGQQRADLEAAAGLSPDHHVGRVAAEGLDVGLEPAQGGDDVEHALVAGARVLGAADLAQIKITQQPQAVVGGHDHDIVGGGQARAIFVLGAARSAGVAAAMAIDHHRTLAPFCYRGCPDVQYEAVLAVGRLVLSIRPAGGLQRRRAQLQRVAHAGPGVRGRSFLEARRSCHLTCVRDALECQGAARVTAAHAACSSFYFDVGRLGERESSGRRWLSQQQAWMQRDWSRRGSGSGEQFSTGPWCVHQVFPCAIGRHFQLDSSRANSAGGGNAANCGRPS